MSTKQNVIADALRLSEAERLELVEALYESLDGPADADAEAARSTELARRIAEIDAGRAEMIPWPEARRRITGDHDGGA